METKRVYHLHVNELQDDLYEHSKILLESVNRIEATLRYLPLADFDCIKKDMRSLKEAMDKINPLNNDIVHEFERVIKEMEARQQQMINNVIDLKNAEMARLLKITDQSLRQLEEKLNQK